MKRPRIKTIEELRARIRAYAHAREDFRWQEMSPERTKKMRYYNAAISRARKLGRARFGVEILICMCCASRIPYILPEVDYCGKCGHTREEHEE